ncbi:MAG TPA: GerAB/ArcD/ProY family transporter [Bacillota bacterium]|nr:GerAB/ArcD/ProY family transporter [Bacillota bacterium]
MNRKQTVSVNQMGFLMMIAGYGGIIFLHPDIITLSGRMAWIAEIFGGIAVIGLALWMLFLTKFYPGKTMFEILETLTGKLISMFFGMLFLLILIITSALFLVQFTMMVKMFFLIVSPMLFPLSLSLITALVIASKGLEPLARSILILGVILLIIFFSTMGLGFIHLFDSSNIFPVFDRDFHSLLSGFHLSAGLLSESLLLLTIMAAYLSSPTQKLMKMTAWFLLFLVLIPGAAVFALMGNISPEESSRILFVGINVAQAISFGRFLQGLEVFLLFTYEIISVLRLGLCINCGQVYCSQIFGHKPAKIIQVIITLAIFSLSLWVGSISQANFYYTLMAKYVIPPFILTVLTLTSLGLWIKRRKERKKTRNQ